MYIYLNVWKQLTDIKLLRLHYNTWNHLTVCKKMSSGSFKNIKKMCLQIIYLIYMYKEDLALNNLQWLICHKTQTNQIIYLIYMYKEDLALNNL